MKILIRNATGQPIYEQIMIQMKNMMITGELKEGDSLPSMRLLAKELRISVITTKRAYEELEREGFIVSHTGRGSYVASRSHELVKEEQLRTIDSLMQKMVDTAKTCGVELEELIDTLKLVYKGE